MRYQDFKEQLKNFQVFSIADIRKVDPKFYPARLNEWQKKGYLQKIRRGYYIFADLALDERVLFSIANKLYSPSYVSLESALSHYELIPEGVYTVTSVSSRKTANFATPIAQFSYRTLKPELLFGHTLEKVGDHMFKIAEIEKAVLDYLYLHPDIVREADFYEWRFNSQEFLARADITKMRAYVKAFNSPVFLGRVSVLLDLIQKSR